MTLKQISEAQDRSARYYHKQIHFMIQHLEEDMKLGKDYADECRDEVYGGVFTNLTTAQYLLKELFIG